MQCVGFLSVGGFEHFEVKRGAITGSDWWQCICDAEPVFASGKFRRLVIDNARVHTMMEQQVRVGGCPLLASLVCGLWIAAAPYSLEASLVKVLRRVRVHHVSSPSFGGKLYFLYDWLVKKVLTIRSNL